MRLSTHFIETLNGAVTIRAFNWVEQNIDMNNRFLNQSQRSTYLFAMIQQWLSMVLNMTVTIIAILFVTLATQVTITAPGLTGVGLVSIMSFGTMLASIVRQYTQLELATAALDRLKQFGETVPDENNNGASDDSVAPDWPSRGNIEIQNVSAAYK